MKKAGIFILIAFLFATNPTRAQWLNFTLTTDSIAYDTTLMHTLYCIGELHNQSSTQTITVDVIRYENDLYDMWECGICTEICYPQDQDTVELILPPNKVQVLKMGFRFFYHPNTVAHAKLVITNRAHPMNYFVQNYYAVDSLPPRDSSPPTPAEVTFPDDITIFPNPFNSETLLKFNDQLEAARMVIFNSVGQLVREESNLSGKSIPVSRVNLPAGVYSVNVSTENKSYYIRMVVTN